MNTEKKNIWRRQNKWLKKKQKRTLDRIEELIVGGNKAVLERLDNVESRLGGVETRLDRLEDGQSEIFDKMQTIHTSLKNEISVTAVAVKETVKEEIRRVEDKLDEHMRQPAHAGV